MSAFGSINMVILMGNLGRDPEVKTLQGGSLIGKFSVATTQGWKDKQTDEWKEKTEWHNIVVWNEHLIKTISKYLKKGTKVYVIGQLETRKWQGNDGQDRYTTEVVLKGYEAKLFVLSGGKTKDDQGADDYEDRGGRSGGGRQEQPRRPLREDIDDEIPF